MPLFSPRRKKSPPGNHLGDASLQAAASLIYLEDQELIVPLATSQSGDAFDTWNATATGIALLETIPR